MGDVFSKHQLAIDSVKDAAGKFDAFGNLKLKVPCDDIPSWLGAESCAKCPDPCKDSELVKLGESEE